MAAGDRRRLPFVQGVIGGVTAWLVGYVLTYLIVAGEIRESPLQRVLEALEGEPATYEMVGWVFYNVHFVETVFRDVPLLGSYATSYVGGEDGFTVALYAVPPATLLAAGLALATYRRVRTATEGALVGLTVVPGYLLASIVGVFLFEVTVGPASGAPEMIPAIAIAGIAYPAVFAGGGGAVAAIRSGRS
ncbi:hypothetical protein [Natrialbaceae archaeon AArc-T1-2]|uniref:hypothetical protein n=1 Tax=Natrialbaceae archaeon AArc-T1-2 TaxID=3053904 RepID=UPI00255AC0C5|nr:hypothetical protein [Natrialbaceae archaeon AArc-T1-2]WIV66209.1 hypothetical protein QQ977_10960 [Natrialbaceae archaeon AArc-T1-2]